MRRILIRGGVALIVLAALWFVTARWCALLVDQIYTPRLAAIEAAPVGWNGTWLQFGTGRFDTLVPGADRGDFSGLGPLYTAVARFTVDADGRLVFVKDDRRFVLGRHAGTLPDPKLPDGETPMPAFMPEPGDTMSAALDRGLLAWPAPYQTNFMTGYAPSWQRTIYQRLSWQKASGARLDLLWRHRQDYDGTNGWTGMRLNDLIRIEIRPASGPPAVWVETTQ
jgi:hypothetical protein